MKKIVYIIFFVSFSIFSQKNDSKIKVLLDSLSNKHFSYMINGNIDGFLNGYSRNFTDLGGGLKSNGTVNFKEWKMKLIKFVSSDKFQKIKGKSVNDLFKLEEKKISNYKRASKRFNYEPKDNDYKVSIPARENSFFHDEWYGIYRLVNNEWKIIAGD